MVVFSTVRREGPAGTFDELGPLATSLARLLKVLCQDASPGPRTHAGTRAARTHVKIRICTTVIFLQIVLGIATVLIRPSKAGSAPLLNSRQISLKPLKQRA